MAETNEELEICHSLENVSCTNGTPNGSSQPKTTDEIVPSVESKPIDEPITTTTTTTTESSNVMD